MQNPFSFFILQIVSEYLSKNLPSQRGRGADDNIFCIIMKGTGSESCNQRPEGVFC